MAYTPSSTFSFVAGSYTPATAFTFASLTEGALSAALAGVTGSLSGDVAGIFGDLSATLDNVTGDLSGNAFTRSGDLSATLSDISGDFTGNTFIRSGELSSVLADVSGDLAGNAFIRSGDLSATLSDISGDFTGNTFIRSGELSSVLADVTGDLAGNAFIRSGDLSATLSDISGDFTGNTFIRSGELSSVLADVSGDLAGNAFIRSGDLSATLSDISGDFGAKVYHHTAAIAAELAGISASLNGNVFIRSGALSSVLADVTGDFGGNAFVRSGVLSAVLDDVSGDLSSQAFIRSGELSATLAGVDAYMLAAIAPQAGLSAALADVSGEFVGLNVAAAGAFDVTLQGVVGYLYADYDANVPRFTTSKNVSVQQNGLFETMRSTLLQQQTSHLRASRCIPRDRAMQTMHDVHIGYGQTTQTSIRRCGTLDTATPLSRKTAAAFDLLAWHTLQRKLMAEQALALNSLAAVVAQQMTKIRPPDWVMPVQDMAHTITHFTYTVYGDPENPYTPAADFSFVANPDYLPNAPFEFLDAPLEIVWSMRHVRGIDGLTFIAPRQQAGPAKTKRCIPVDASRRPPPGVSPHIDPERPPYEPPPYEPPPSDAPFTIPTQSVYTMQHVISVKTVPGNIEVPVGQVSLSYDADSFAWQFNASLLDAAALSLVSAIDGEPVTLAVNVDGLVWHVLVENIEQGIQFAKRTISLKGRSLTALLGAPYRLSDSVTQGDSLTVQQLAETVLPYGWTIVWNAPTWLVPGDAYSYTNQTPIQALSALVNDIGCVAIPHAVEQQITVQRRYPVYPWQFDSAQAGLTIPESALKSVSLRPSITTQANGVYVHGGDIGGVLGWCRLNGTAGDRLAPTVSNALMTDVTGCRLLGERILAGQFPQPIIRSATLPLDNDLFPLARVGQLVEIALGTDTIKGIVNSVSIDASLNSVSQTIQIGEETANVWTLFNALLPRDPLLVGTVYSTDGTISVVTLLDGGIVSVRGTATVNSKVYIRAGRIESAAPNLTQNDIII